MMEKLLDTVLLPDGARLEIVQLFREYNEGEWTPGLKVLRIDGADITLSDARDRLTRAGRQDVLQKHRIP